MLEVAATAIVTGLWGVIDVRVDYVPKQASACNRTSNRVGLSINQSYGAPPPYV